MKQTNHPSEYLHLSTFTGGVILTACALTLWCACGSGDPPQGQRAGHELKQFASQADAASVQSVSSGASPSTSTPLDAATAQKPQAPPESTDSAGGVQNPPPHTEEAEGAQHVQGKERTQPVDAVVADTVNAAPTAAQGAQSKPAEAAQVQARSGERAELPTLEEFAKEDLHYEELLHWRNKRKWGTAPSMGDPKHGHLPGGEALPLEGVHHGVLKQCQGRATNFGSPHMLKVVKDAAEQVHGSFGGPRLMVCNISIEGGGPMRWSRSHAAGRDVDFAFFTFKDGQPVEPTQLLAYKDGVELKTEAETWAFDVPRNWALIKSLLTHPDADVQWIFVSTPLRRAMLDHALKQGEPLELMIKARQIVRQPLDSKSHNDHFHVRFMCNPGERIHGCRDDEPFWPWTGRRDLRLARRAAAYAMAMRARKRDWRELAMMKIRDRRLYDASSALVETALMDPIGDLRGAAADLLTIWQKRNAEVVYTLEHFLRAEGGGFTQDDPAISGTQAVLADSARGAHFKPWQIKGRKRHRGHIRRAYALLGNLGAEESAPFLADALRSKRTIEEYPEPLLAARAARHVMSPILIPALIDALEHRDKNVREASVVALRRISNHNFGRAWGKVSRKHIGEGVAMWRAWWQEHKHMNRVELVRAGFARYKVDLGDLRREEAVPALVYGMDHPAPLPYNADRMLAWLTGRRTVLDGSIGGKRRRWRDWIHAD